MFSRSHFIAIGRPLKCLRDSTKRSSQKMGEQIQKYCHRQHHVENPLFAVANGRGIRTGNTGESTRTVVKRDYPFHPHGRKKPTSPPPHLLTSPPPHLQLAVSHTTVNLSVNAGAGSCFKMCCWENCFCLCFLVCLSERGMLHTFPILSSSPCITHSSLTCTLTPWKTKQSHLIIAFFLAITLELSLCISAC